MVPTVIEEVPGHHGERLGPDSLRVDVGMQGDVHPRVAIFGVVFLVVLHEPDDSITHLHGKHHGLVITHSHHDLHWDHGLVNRATVSSLRRTPCDLLAFLSSPEMNAQTRSFGQCFADVSSYIDTKIDAISCHKSQLPKLDVESLG